MRTTARVPLSDASVGSGGKGGVFQAHKRAGTSPRPLQQGYKKAMAAVALIGLGWAVFATASVTAAVPDADQRVGVLNDRLNAQLFRGVSSDYAGAVRKSRDIARWGTTNLNRIARGTYPDCTVRLSRLSVAAVMFGQTSARYWRRLDNDRAIQPWMLRRYWRQLGRVERTRAAFYECARG